MIKEDILKEMRRVLLGKELATKEETSIVLNMKYLEDVVVKIADCLDPREKGIYQFVPDENKFKETTGFSNYLPEFTAQEFVEALEKFDYQVTIMAA